MFDPKNTLAFQGSPGAYSDMACRSAYPEMTTLANRSFEDTFDAVRTGNAALAMIPIENSVAGRVADIHHFLPGSGLHIVAEHFLRIRFHLMGVPGPVTSAQSAGVHQMLREDAALVVTRSEELLETLAPAGERTTARVRGADGPRDRLTHRQRQVLEAVPLRRPADDFSIAGTAGLAPLEVRGTLLVLAEQGYVQREGVGWRLADADPRAPGQPYLDSTG